MKVVNTIRHVQVFMVMALFAVNGLAAQVTAKDSVITSIRITGTVMDLTPMPNITVLEKNTSNTAITDRNGRFALDIPIRNFTKDVYLKFESLQAESVETKIEPHTRHLTVQFNKSKARSSRWTIRQSFQKPNVSKIISKTIEALLESMGKQHLQQH